MEHIYMLAAMHSGAGKTSLCFALLQYLKEKGVAVQSYKTGPDYIDTAYHSLVSGRACINLEPYFLESEDGALLREVFARYAGDAQICVIEAAMGYYDGIYGQEPRASAYTVAKALHAEVCLIADTQNAEEIAAYVRRYADKGDSRIRALILNRCKKEWYLRHKEEIEKSTGLPLLGYVEERELFHIPERHLGLHMPQKEELESLAAAMAKELARGVDLSFFQAGGTKAPVPVKPVESAQFRLAIAKDAAFCFFYEENLRILREAGAEILFFSPLEEENLPQDIDGLWLPGGYPELYARQLSENEKMRSRIKEAAEGGLPLVAECGGFLYLHRRMEGTDHKSYAMAAVFDADAYRTERLQRFGYIELTAAEDTVLLPKGESCRSHEFHYWDSEKPGSSCHAVKANKTKAWDCVRGSKTMFAGFPHLYLGSNKKMAERFAAACRRYREERKRCV